MGFNYLGRKEAVWLSVREGNGDRSEQAERGQNDPTEWEAFCCPLGNAGRRTLHLPSSVGLFCTPPFYYSFPHSVTPAPVLLPVLILPSFYICMVQNTISSTLNKS